MFTMTSLLVVLGMCYYSAQACCNDACPCDLSRHRCDFFLDISNPRSIVSPSGGPGISWQSPLTSVRSSNGCTAQGVLRLNPPRGKTKLTIEMCLNDPTGWTFHAGDSPSNNGWGGDSGHTHSCAEGHNVGDNALIYRAFNGSNSHRPRLLMANLDKFVKSGQFNMEIMKDDGHGRMVKLTNADGQTAEFRDDLLFVWDQKYFGINRVVSTRYRSGTGLCQACLWWS